MILTHDFINGFVVGFAVGAFLLWLLALINFK